MILNNLFLNFYQLCIIFCSRFGYVDLANAEDLDKAIALSGQELDGSEITVERAKPKNQSFNEPKGQTQQYGGRQERDASGKTASECMLVSFYTKLNLKSLGGDFSSVISSEDKKADFHE